MNRILLLPADGSSVPDFTGSPDLMTALICAYGAGCLHQEIFFDGVTSTGKIGTSITIPYQIATNIVSGFGYFSTIVSQVDDTATRSLKPLDKPYSVAGRLFGYFSRGIDGPVGPSISGPDIGNTISFQVAGERHDVTQQLWLTIGITKSSLTDAYTPFQGFDPSMLGFYDFDELANEMKYFTGDAITNSIFDVNTSIGSVGYNSPVFQNLANSPSLPTTTFNGGIKL